MPPAKRSFLVSGLCLVLGLAACASDPAGPDDATCDGDSCDEAPFQPDCAQLVDRSGRGFLPSTIKTDALVSTVYHGASKTCSVKADEIVRQLKSRLAGGKCNVQTRVISETEVLANGGAKDHRAVTTLACGGTPAHQVLVSTFGFADPRGTDVPGGVEIAVFQESQGVFNYYKEVGGKMAFFGSSKDFVLRGPGGPNITDERGCANCHPDGGLVMKETMFPWLHWEPSASFAGIISARQAWMGTQIGGQDLEGFVVEPANAVWNNTRVDILSAEGSLKELLRPLFCPVTFGVGSSPEVGTLAQLRAEMLYSPGIAFYDFAADKLKNLGGIGQAGSIFVPAADYAAIRDAVGQRVAGLGAKDTHFSAPFIHQGHQDANYLDQLIGRKIIDQALARDVLMVDFTRPLSADRCALLDSLDGVQTAAADQNPTAIRDALLAAFSGAAAGTPAAQLVAHLEARKAGAPFDHVRTLAVFNAACGARNTGEKVTAGSAQVSALLADVIKLNSLRKQTFGTAPVFEFDATLSQDEIAIAPGAAPDDLRRIDPGARLHPVDCKLVTGFTAVAK